MLKDRLKKKKPKLHQTYYFILLETSCEQLIGLAILICVTINLNPPRSCQQVNECVGNHFQTLRFLLIWFESSALIRKLVTLKI